MKIRAFSNFLVCLPIILLGSPNSLGQKSGSGSQQGASQQSGNAASPSSSQAAPAPGGITNETLPIEATILAYKELSADAAGIATAVNKKTDASTILVIGTSTDLAAVVQLRSALAQAAILQSRLESLESALKAVSSLPTYSVAPFQGQAAAGTPFIQGPADIATLIQTIGSMTAVNENLTSAPGALSDNTLISLMAGRVTAKAVYFPSQMPPLILEASDLTGTYLGSALTKLERAREDLLELSLNYSQAVADAKLILAAKPGTFSPTDVSTAGILAQKAARIASLNDLASKAITAVDLFESSLLTGQAPAQPSQTASNLSNGSSPSGGANPALPAPTLPGAAGGTPGAAGPAAANPPAAAVQSNQGGSQASQLQSQQQSAGSSPLQQLLYADLLLHSVLSAGTIDHVKLLALHALESGGGQMSKSNLFLGSRIYFSGGAIASFTLYDSNSAVVCSGVSYGYRGYLREKDTTAAMTDNVSPSQVVTNCK